MMAKKIALLCVAAAVIAAAGCAGGGVEVDTTASMFKDAGKYVYKSAIAGGGGFIDGIHFHPAEKGLVYLRTDMGGAYRRDINTENWIPLNDMFPRDEADNFGILSLALDPNDTNKVYLMTGKYTQDWAGKGVFLISDDRGNNWKKVPLPFKVGGNEDGRGCGERIAVDPNKTSILYMGSTRDGLWKSEDSGESWERLESFKPVNVNFVAVDPGSGKKGTVSRRIFASAADISGSVYISDDAGKTWMLLPGAPKKMMGIRNQIVKNFMYVTFADAPGPNGATMGAAYKYDIAKGRWTNLNLPEGPGGFSGISVNEKDPNDIIVSTLDSWGGPDDVFRTKDGGKIWNKTIKGAEWDYSYAPYVSHDFTPHWIADAKMDPYDPDHVMFVTGYGLWATKNHRGAPCRWYFDNKMLEQTVPLEIISPAFGKAHLVSALGDVDGFRYEEDFDKSPPDRHSPPRWTTLSVAVAWNKPDFMVKTINKPPFGAYSMDNGITWTDFAKKPESAVRGGGTRSICITADGGTIVWYPEKAELVYSRDKGATWTKCGGGVPGVRPVADTVNPNKVYAYDSNTGSMWVSNDAGANFSKQSGNFDFVQKWTVDDCMSAAVAGKEGHVWVTADSKGLFRTSDSGNTAVKIQNVDEAYRIGFGKAAPGKNYPAVFITGKVNGVYGFYRSDDEGANWIRINDDRHNYGWIHCIIGDPRIYGRVYLALEGRGVVYGDVLKDDSE